MTTLTPFMNASRTVAAERRAEALSRVVSMLLQGIALHSFASESPEAAGFQAAIRKVRSDFDKVDDDQDSALLLAGAAIRLMEDYNDGVRLQARARQVQYETAVGVLSEGFLELARASADTRADFEQIVRELGSSGVEELRAAVEAIRDEVADPLKKCGIPGGEVDSSTGLPDYGFAAAAMAEVWQRRENHFAAIFAAERLETINMRYGFAAGDQVLHLLGRTVGKALTAGDRLFRWRGPCVMALLKRDAPEAFVAGDLARVASTKMEHGITLGDREVMLSVSTSWNLFPLKSASSLEELLERMNKFAATRVAAPKGALGSPNTRVARA